MQLRWRPRVVLLCALLFLQSVASHAAAQITTGAVAGTIQDSEGGVVSEATVVLISESRGTRSMPVVTSEMGHYVIPNVTADTYTVEVTVPGFRTIRRSGVPVTGGSRVAVETLTVVPGAAHETIEVVANAPLLQSQSGERSFAVSSEQIDALPIVGIRNFVALTALAPGTDGTNRLGGGGQNNLMIDGISAMDTATNSQMLPMNTESIAAVKVLIQSYQAEFGRSSGLQVTAVTRSGTNQFRGSFYDIEENSAWNTNSWANQKNGDPKPVSRSRALGYAIGGPVGRPGESTNRLFFFYAHEYRPSETGGQIVRLRVPTLRERQGDFSQSLNAIGQPIPQLLDPLTRQPYPNNVIPAGSLYAPGLAVLNQYPAPNHEQQPGEGYNLEVVRPMDRELVQQPAARVDYQFSPRLRLSAKYSGQRQRERVVPGTLPGFNDALLPRPYISNYGVTANYALGSRAFLEATYGTIKNEIALGGLMANASANRLGTLSGLPLIYPDAGELDARSYQRQALERSDAVFFDGARVNLPPIFGWGSLVGAGPPSHAYPGVLSTNRTQDLAVSLTTVAGPHTLKLGFYNNHSLKAQNVGPVGGAPFQGAINFGNNPSNPFDTGFGFANAATGVFSEYAQASKLIEANLVYNNMEFYAQDNWKVGDRLTVDAGVRLTRQQPQYDRFGRMSNFFPEVWFPGMAPLLYVPACRSGAPVCGGLDRNAAHPVTGEILEAPGSLSSALAIGTIVPRSGDPANGIRLAGDEIAETGYVWPKLVYAPRFGVAYDVSGTQRLIVRGGGGRFYDRPEGNTVIGIPANPPASESQILANGRLQTLGQGLSVTGVPSVFVFEYNSDIPSSIQWNAGVQMALPWASSLDVSYVGQRSENRLQNVNINAIDIGAAYRAENRDPTLPASGPGVIPGSTALPPNLLRAFRGYGAIVKQTPAFHDRYHSIQTSFVRRFQSGLSFGVNYTLSLSYTGTIGLTQRLEHDALGSVRLRADQAEFEELMKDLNLKRHVIHGNVVWDLPNLAAGNGARRVLSHLANDWQLAAIVTAGSGNRYDLQYAYQNGATNIHLTGSPDYAARIIYTGDPGSGCLSNQYAQFNTAVVRGPSYESDGLESGRNVLSGCPDKTVDLSLSRNFRVGGNRSVQFRVDAFNAFNVVVINNRQTTVRFDNPENQRILNNQFLEDGTLNPNHLTPLTAGFGAAVGAQPMRTVRLALRFSF